MSREAFPLPKEGTGLHTIAFDLDGTLAEPTWPSSQIGGPIELGVRALRWYAERGFEIVLYTARPAEYRDRIRWWLVRHGLSNLVYSIVTDKPRAALYIDDRALAFPEAFPQGPRRMRYLVSRGEHRETMWCAGLGCTVTP